MRRALRAGLQQEIPFFMAMPAIVWQLLFFYIPLCIIFCVSFLRVDQGGIVTGVTLAHYKELVAAPFMQIIGRSLVLALLTAFSCLVVAYPVAYFLASKVTRAKELLLFLLTLPFWTNFLIQLYAWYFLLERHGLLNRLLLNLHVISEPLELTNSMGAVFLVMFYCYLPFMIMPIYSTLQKVNPVLLEASADLGATRWQRFRSITLPLSMSGVMTGLFLVFVPAFSEFVIPALLGGAKYMFVGSLISYYFLVARNLFLGAAFTCMAGAVLLLVGAVIYTVFARSVR